MINIYIGSDIHNIKAEKALKHSILKHTKHPVNIVVMSRFGTDQTWKNWAHRKTWATEFSCFRWAIPAAMNFQGKGIYLDSDMLVVSDILDLFEQDCSLGACTTPKRETSVMVFDCAKFKDQPEFQLEHLKENAAQTGLYGKMLKERGMMSTSVSQDWNCLDGTGYSKDTKLIHFTDLNIQPWHPAPHRFTYRQHPNKELAALWLKYYEESFEEKI